MADAPTITSFQHHFVPAPEPGSRHLVVVLHGLGDSLYGFLWLPEQLALPGVSYLLVNAPQPYVMGYAWYDLADPEPGVRHGRVLLTRLFNELAAAGWPPEQTLLFGFSQGCLMTLDFGLRFDKPLAGLVGISGYVHQPERVAEVVHPQAKRQHWLVTHGDADELLPLQRTADHVARLQAAGVPVAFHTFHKPHTIDPDEELPLLRRWIGERFQDGASSNG